MGGVWSGGKKRASKKVGTGEKNISGFSGKLKSKKSFNKHKESSTNADDFVKTTPKKQRYYSGELLSTFSTELKPSTPIKSSSGKVNQKGSFLGKAGAAGLEKAVEVLDTLGSSMSNLNAGSGFITGMASRGNRISILAFEVANTITKGATLFQSLSKENVQLLKEEILHSEGVQRLVSTDMKELLLIAAADKREEFDVFSKEVIRFGDRCKDPQWHNLGRYFSKLDSEYASDKQPEAVAEKTMQELTMLAQHTSELYHELHALDRFEQDYQRKLDEMESLNLPQKGESLTILQSELKEQRKLVRSLKKKSLWFKNQEEIVEKLVDIVTYLHQEISEAFGNNGVTPVTKEPRRSPPRLGTAGLALHYANIINQIDTIASRASTPPPNTRDALYHALPTSVKTALRSQVQAFDVKEELTINLVKDKMEKTLQWLVPIATNTIKAHQGFGWVGEWANNGNEFGKNTASNNNLIRLQTLYHAEKQKTELHILELVTWLHHLINLARQRDNDFRAIPFQSPIQKEPFSQTKTQLLVLQRNHHTVSCNIQLSQEDRDLLKNVCGGRKLVSGLSKSQEFASAKKRGSIWERSRSAGNSPVNEHGSRRKLTPKTNMLDVMDGLDSNI